VITLSITGALNAVLSDEHKKEMIRYLYNHQACFFFFFEKILALLGFSLIFFLMWRCL
jgi:hypothetical protein